VHHQPQGQLYIVRWRAMTVSLAIVLFALSTSAAVGLVVQPEQDSKKVHIKAEEPTWHAGQQIEELAANSQKHLQKVRDNYNAHQKKTMTQAAHEMNKAAQQMNNKQATNQLKKVADQMKAAHQTNNKQATNELKKVAHQMNNKHADTPVWQAQQHQKNSDKDQQKAGESLQKAAKNYMHDLQKATEKNQKASSLAEGESELATEVEAEDARPKMKEENGKGAQEWQLLKEMYGEKHPEKKGNTVHIPKHGQWDNQRRMVNAKHQQEKAYKKSLQRTMNLQHHHPPADLEHSWVTSHMTHSR